MGRSAQSAQTPGSPLALSPPLSRIDSLGRLLGRARRKTPFFLVLILATILTAAIRRQTAAVLQSTEHALKDLQLLSSLLARLEREHFESPACRASSSSSPRTTSPAHTP
ncbi:hypothetical protein RBB78_08575 [Tunturiibacter empetritectus]|uniref:hypothetical protein n=1 Tax=Tunturiibacter empetritectus TaxID=3069691 RepID=UPI003D9AC5E1